MSRTPSVGPRAGLGLLILLVAACAGRPPRVVDGIPEAGPGRIAGLYARHCAACHGADGGGDGLAAAYLFPAPRDFGDGRFRLVRTTNGAPTDADLVGCIERGMPGAAMPAFGWLPAEDVLALARHVRELAILRLAADLLSRYALAGRPLAPDEARDVAVWRLTPADEVEVPAPVAATAEVLARGRVVFLERCAACHGTEAEGQRPDRAWAAIEGLYWARDLRRGPLKGGATQADLAHRVLAGMPGVAMPPVRFGDPADAQALLAYLGGILPADAAARGVQRRGQLVAARVDRVPDEPDDPRWAEVRPLEVALMALAYRESCIEAAELRALHDGTTLAVRLSWRDPTRDDRAIGGASRWPDQAALQISDEELPPLFGMGAHETMVDIWHWAAFRPRELAGALDLIGAGRADVPPAPAPGLWRPAERADEVEARGLDLPRSVREGAIQARPRYADGRWSLVFVRPLGGPGPRPDGGLALREDGVYQLGCAVWNGSAEDQGARKAISIWQELRLAGAGDRR
jgi:DMSO reductase family type II enzyme heme b subunit